MSKFFSLFLGVVLAFAVGCSKDKVAVSSSGGGGGGGDTKVEAEKEKENVEMVAEAATPAEAADMTEAMMEEKTTDMNKAVEADMSKSVEEKKEATGKNTATFKRYQKELREKMEQERQAKQGELSLKLKEFYQSMQAAALDVGKSGQAELVKLKDSDIYQSVESAAVTLKKIGQAELEKIDEEARRKFNEQNGEPAIQ